MKKLKLGILLVVTCLFVTACGCSKKTTYTVTFDSNGGTTVESQTVDKNGVVKEPADPTREGYTFGGWYIDIEKDEKYDFSTKVTKNITLTAKWNAGESAELTVTFTGEGVTTTTKTVKSGEKVEKILDPTRNGYNFLGWFIGDKEYDFDTPVTENITLTAKWGKVSSGNTGTASKPKPKPKPTPGPTTVSVTGISVNVNAVTLKVGETKGLTVTVNPENATNRDLTYSSSNENVAKVAADGTITAVSAGSATITITSVDGSHTATVTVTVIDAYTYTTEKLDEAGQSYKVYIYKNGTQISGIQAVYNASGRYLGQYEADKDAIMVASMQVDSIAKIKVNGEFVNITKK